MALLANRSQPGRAYHSAQVLVMLLLFVLLVLRSLLICLDSSVDWTCKDVRATAILHTNKA